MKFGIRGQLTDVITCVKFLVNRFRGYGVLTPPKLPFPIDLLRRPYNSVALPCDTVTSSKSQAADRSVSVAITLSNLETRSACGQNCPAFLHNYATVVLYRLITTLCLCHRRGHSRCFLMRTDSYLCLLDWNNLQLLTYCSRFLVYRARHKK